MHIQHIRKSILHMVHYSKSSHVGSCLSIVEILYTLYFKVMNIDPRNPLASCRDKFLLSKGHASAALYATLAERGFFSKEYLNKYYIDGSILPGHLVKESVPGVEASSGSLGHGLSLGIGMSIANKYHQNSGKIYVLLGDGECNEGSIWEAAMLAATLKLDNLTAVIDYNQLQGYGRTNEVINQSNMAERWRSFDWDVYEVNGHDCEALVESFHHIQHKPKLVLAHTTKGKGISFMENKLEWHYKSPNDEQYQRAINELDKMV